MFTVTIEKQDFLDLATVASFASTDSTRSILTGVLLECDGKKITATATDSYKLAIIERDTNTETTKASTLAPSKFLTECAKAVKAAKYGNNTVIVEVEDEVITIKDTAETFVLMHRAVEGKYPEVAHLIPKERGIKEFETVAFSPRFLADFIKLAPFCNDKGKVIASEQAIRIVSLQDNVHPMVVTDWSKRTQALLMPIRIG